ncbi:MAG: transcriptional repressor NrdR [Lentisphaeria bacterium]|nr:transcriptional repressor NrdR [Lentisphaeria bacterium]
MRCPRCSCQNDKVVDSRSTKDGAGVRRRRECLQCGHRFTTHEEIIQAELKVIKRDNTREDFDRQKLREGIEKACWKRDVVPEDLDALISRVCTGLEADYDREVPSGEIGERVMRELCKLDKVAYIRFASIYRDYQGLSEFISEVRSIDKQKS